MPFISFLDISYNNLSTLQHILDVLSTLPALETLVMINATRSKETAIPREYAFKVCKVLRNLLTVDGLKNPFGTVALRKPQLKRAPTIMRIAQSMQESEMPPDSNVEPVPTIYDFDASRTGMGVRYYCNVL
jgi:hypothetical protein